MEPIVLNLQTIGAMTLVATFTAIPVLAQQTTQTGVPPAAAPTATAPIAANPPGVVATTNNPNLAVAAVKLENGTRASKLVGASVYNDANDKIGSVDDLIVTQGDKVTVAIVSVGGFLGLGSKLVAIPFPQLKMDGDKLVLAGVTRDALTAMPSFVY